MKKTDVSCNFGFWALVKVYCVIKGRELSFIITLTNNEHRQQNTCNHI